MKYKVGDRVQIYDLETWGEVEVEIVKVNRNSYRCTDGRTVWPEVREDYIEKFISSGKKIEKGCPFDEPGCFNPNPPKQEPDYRALYEQEKVIRMAAEKMLCDQADMTTDEWMEAFNNYQQLKQQYNGKL